MMGVKLMGVKFFKNYCKHHKSFDDSMFFEVDAITQAEAHGRCEVRPSVAFSVADQCRCPLDSTH